MAEDMRFLLKYVHVVISLEKGIYAHITYVQNHALLNIEKLKLETDTLRDTKINPKMV
jgi:hypothetical protein